jgi:hypothetical protein
MATRLIIAGCRLYLNPPAVDAGVGTEKPGLRKRSPDSAPTSFSRVTRYSESARRSRIGT